MIVNKIQQNPLQQKRPINKAAVAPSFTGMKNKDILPYQKTFKWMKNQEWLKGEAGGILITALGTGIVAPVVIGTNPLVRAPKDATVEEKKEVTNKKWYTAIRQPLSAVLAGLFQLGVLKYIDRFLDSKFNIKENSKYVDLHLDQCEINNKSYREGLAKAQFKAQGRTKPSLFQIFTKGYRTTMDARKQYDEDLKALVDDIGDKQLQKVADRFLESGQIHIGDRQLDNPTLAKLVNERIDEYVKDADDLKKKDVSHYSRKAKLLMGNKESIQEILKNVPKDEAGAVTYIKNMLKNEQNPEVREILEDIMDRSEDLWGNRSARTLERIQKISDACNNSYSLDTYIDTISLRNKELDRIITKLNLEKIKDINAVDDKTINEVIKRVVALCRFDESDDLLRPILRNTETFDSNLQQLMAKVHKDIAKGYKELVEHEYKAINQAAKVGIGVFITLPITCTALNIIYPRFMDTFFPGLSGKKDKKAEAAAEGGK